MDGELEAALGVCSGFGSIAVVVAVLLGVIFLERVVAQQRTEREVRGDDLRLLISAGDFCDQARLLRLARGDLAEGVAAEVRPIAFLVLARLADADEDQALDVQLLRRQDFDGRFGLGFELGGFRGLRGRTRCSWCSGPARRAKASGRCRRSAAQVAAGAASRRANVISSGVVMWERCSSRDGRKDGLGGRPAGRRASRRPRPERWNAALKLADVVFDLRCGN